MAKCECGGPSNHERDLDELAGRDPRVSPTAAARHIGHPGSSMQVGLMLDRIKRRRAFEPWVRAVKIATESLQDPSLTDSEKVMRVRAALREVYVHG